VGFQCDARRVPYLEGESVLAGAEPHVLHGGAVDHHPSHLSAGHKHWAAGLTEKQIYKLFDVYNGDHGPHEHMCELERALGGAHITRLGIEL